MNILKGIKTKIVKSRPSVKPAKEIWVVGYPGSLGGAGTELDHQIDLWRYHGVEVHLVHIYGFEEGMDEWCNKRGCITHHEYKPDMFKDKIVVAFCNDHFLDKLPEIMTFGRPRKTVFMNCMTWHFDKELEAHKMGWIDIFAFQCEYQRKMLIPKLAEIRPVQEMYKYKPYFNLNNFQGIRYDFKKAIPYFGIGRMSRDDPYKYAEDTWRIMDKICVPKDQEKKIFMLGFGEQAWKKCGSPPPTLDWMTYDPMVIKVSEFLKKIHVMIHKTGGSRENLPRAVLEAWCAGVVPIVEHDYGFPEIIENGVNGFMCSSSDEMSYRASELAFDEIKRKRMAETAYQYLKDDLGNPDKCFDCWEVLLNS